MAYPSDRNVVLHCKPSYSFLSGYFMDISTRLVTYIIIVIIAMVFLLMPSCYDTKVELLNYLVRSFCHADAQHLLINAISFYNLTYIESAIGSAQFGFAIFFIWIVSSVLLWLVHKMIPSRKVTTVGFSGVIFGLIIVYFNLLGTNSTITIVGLLVSIIPQFFMPRISFEGHLCGIVAGVIYCLLFKPKQHLKPTIASSAKPMIGF